MRIMRLLARRLRSRLGLVKSANVLDHGADPRGRWDSTKAVQRSINFAGMDAVQLSRGRFRISRTLRERET